MTAHRTIRVLQDAPLDGPTNMARDEALMTCVGRSESPPTMRLYQWDPPTISLGYFQPYADYASLPPPAGELPVVRRLTGGGAILHDQEVTYSLILPSDHPLLSKGASRLYEVAHDAVIACVRSLGLEASYAGQTDDSGPARGPFFCFQRRHRCDLLIGPDKIAGSAQRRTREALLQHGSIILSRRYVQQESASLLMPLEDGIQHVRSEYPQHLSDVTGQILEPGDWSPAELALADDLIGKYTSEPWTRRA